MNASHTPAPWAFERAVEANGSVTFDIFNSDVSACNGVGGGVAYIQTYNAQQAVVQEANARLICAAPDLLAALKECAAVCAGETMNKNGLIRALEMSRAAIAKATGVQS
jgi:hypothetical protein